MRARKDATMTHWYTPLLTSYKGNISRDYEVADLITLAAVQDGGPPCLRGYWSGTIIDEGDTDDIAALAKVQCVSVQDLNDEDAAYVYVGADHSFMTLDATAEGDVTISLVTRDQDSYDQVKAWCENNLSKQRPRGSCYTIVQTSRGVETTFLDFTGAELERGNYMPDTLEQYDYAVKQLCATEPAGRILIVDGEAGTGKCLGPEVEVLRYDGNIVKARDVKTGDLLMGPDSTPRKVRSTCTGTGPMFQIQPTKGESWTCNDVHVLTLVDSHTGEVTDIGLDEYEKTTVSFKRRHKLIMTGVDFPPQAALPIDPYFIGIWIGDGAKDCIKLKNSDNQNLIKSIGITKNDTEIQQACDSVAETWGGRVVTRIDRRNQVRTHYLRGTKFLDAFRDLIGDGSKIPHTYLVASRADRLQLLAGILDTDGHHDRSGFEITQKRKNYADGICFLSRSLGFRCTVREKFVNGSKYYRMFISGDLHTVPTRIERKQATKRKQIKDHKRTGFKVEFIGDGEYAGWELDGDGRFLLGDYTVTHNTHLVRALIHDVEDALFIIIPQGMLETLVGPSMIGLLLEVKDEDRPIIFVLEDADDALVPRDGGNISLISALLNMGDGIIGQALNVRIICTTNARADQIDAAIMRPGRLISHMHVGSLPVDFAKEVLARLCVKAVLPERKDKKAVGFGTTGKPAAYTLAEIYEAARKACKDIEDSTELLDE